MMEDILASTDKTKMQFNGFMTQLASIMRQGAHINPLMDLRNSKWWKMEINTVLSGADFGKFNQKPRAQTCVDATQYVNIQYEQLF